MGVLYRFNPQYLCFIQSTPRQDIHPKQGNYHQSPRCQRLLFHTKKHADYLNCITKSAVSLGNLQQQDWRTTVEIHRCTSEQLALKLCRLVPVLDFNSQSVRQATSVNRSVLTVIYPPRFN